MLRIFVTSNQISTVFCATIAKKTRKQGDTDLLLIDHFFKKESLISLIYSSSEIHNWNAIIDFSKRKPDDFDLKPGLWKKFSRSVKHLPIIRSLYKLTINFYLQKRDKKDAQLIFNELNKHTTVHPGSEVELFLLTQTVLNNGLIKLFKSPVINYYEHGLVDYLYVLEKKQVNKFYAVFADSCQNLLRQKKKSSLNVQGYLDYEDVLNAFPESNKAIDLTKNTCFTKFALILLDSSEIFNVPATFWTKFLERCINQITSPEEYGIIIKPHPGQSNDVMALVSEFCATKPNLILLSDPLLVSMSVESIYVSNRNRIDYVFSTYSAAEFYLARFFEGHTQFYFLYDFIKPYYLKGPKQYTDALIELEPYIHHVFSSKACLFLK